MIQFDVSLFKDGTPIHEFQLKSVDQLVGVFSILQPGMSLSVDCILVDTIQSPANQPVKGV